MTLLLVCSILTDYDFFNRLLDDLEVLIDSNQLSANAKLRQQLAQEFFFHLAEACEYLAQLVNEKKA
jgi:hypothetical protein